MTTIKSYTDLEQSKKLAKILPLESADMYFEPSTGYCTEPSEVRVGDIKYAHPRSIRCWSLASLLGVASTYCSRLEITLRADKKYNVFAVKNDFVFRSFDDHLDGFDNLVDACVETILKLHELKML